MPTSPIYHLVPESQFRALTGAQHYEAPSLAAEGFAHCTSGVDLVLVVANDYFSRLAESLLVLELDPEKLRSPLVFEAAAPIAGGGSAHLEGAPEFPHVYGPIAWESLRSVSTLRATSDGFVWPDESRSLDSFKAESA